MTLLPFEKCRPKTRHSLRQVTHLNSNDYRVSPAGKWEEDRRPASQRATVSQLMSLSYSVTQSTFQKESVMAFQLESQTVAQYES